ncbi:MAG TPA: chromosome partitioning protein [Actinoplanes sp.]|nr:chromosome partitioning protein [Actinoplanes sp.]
MEDEHADRVHVPGTKSTPPARDVEPFWPPEELDAPVHGGRPVPHGAPPAVPIRPSPPDADPGLYRPADRLVVPPPSPRSTPDPRTAPDPRTRPDPRTAPVQPSTPTQRTAPVEASAPIQPSADPPTQAWPNIAPRSATPAPAPAAPPPVDDDASAAAARVVRDSPWAQPPQRPGTQRPAAQRQASAGQAPHAPASHAPASHAPAPHGATPHGPTPHGPTPHGPAPHSPATHGPVAPGQPPPGRPSSATNAVNAAGPNQPDVAHQTTYYPTVTPPRSPENGGTPHNGDGPVYRPEPRPNGQTPAAPSGPTAPPAQAAPPRPTPPGPFPPAMNLPPPSKDPYQQVPWVSDGTPTAEEFARRRLARPAEPTATMGARALLQKGTMGLVRLAPGKYEREYKQDVEMVRRNFGGLRQVTVVNPKGGAGKTVAVLLLAMTFGQKRGGYVLAWDNNETQGTLGMRAQQDFHARTVRDMMRDLHLFRGAHGRVGDLSQYVRAQGEGMFDVLASDESATAGEMLTAEAFAEIREIVSRFYKLIFVDTGNNVRAQNWQAAMDATDQLMITMSARNDSAETAARMLDHLEQSGRQRLVRQAVTVVTMPPTRKDIDLPPIQQHFAARTRAVLLAPYEKLIDSGEPIRYGQLSNNTKDAWLKIAAAVAEGL